MAPCLYAFVLFDIYRLGNLSMFDGSLPSSGGGKRATPPSQHPSDGTGEPVVGRYQDKKQKKVDGGGEYGKYTEDADGDMVSQVEGSNGPNVFKVLLDTHFPEARERIYSNVYSNSTMSFFILQHRVEEYWDLDTTTDDKLVVMRRILTENGLWSSKDEGVDDEVDDEVVAARMNEYRSMPGAVTVADGNVVLVPNFLQNQLGHNPVQFHAEVSASIPDEYGAGEPLERGALKRVPCNQRPASYSMNVYMDQQQRW
jgi:hypothetical protein